MRRLFLALALVLFAGAALAQPALTSQPPITAPLCWSGSVWSPCGSSTNAFYNQFSRAIVVTGTFTPSATYAINNDVGGLITIATGLPAGTVVQLVDVAVSWTVAANSAFSNPYMIAFDASPSTTLTDGSTPTWNAADPAKIVAILVASGSSGTSAGNLLITLRLFAASAYLPVDASGKLYITLLSAGTITTTTPTTATWVAKVLY